MTPAGYFLWNGVHWEQVSEAFADDPDVVALYRTGRPQYDSRCDTCAHCGPSQRGSRYDRTCSLHDARVKTHGVCQQRQSRGRQHDIPRA